MEYKRRGIVYFVILSRIVLVTLAYEKDEKLDVQNDEDKPQVQVRAVFLNCEVDDSSSNSEGGRFEREELIKHNALKDCVKKLALTLKITSELENSGDEYLPIEHVFEGPVKKRVRLLDPYILRLQRDTPLQAYKLRKLETVTGVLINSADKEYVQKLYDEPRDRVQRDADLTLFKVNDNTFTASSDVQSLLSYPEQTTFEQTLQPGPIYTTEYVIDPLKNCEKKHACAILNNTSNKRCKRNEHNIVVETVTDSDNKWMSDNYVYRNSAEVKNKQMMDYNEEPSVNNIYNPIKSGQKKENANAKRMTLKNAGRKNNRSNIKAKNSVKNKTLHVENDETYNSRHGSPFSHVTSASKDRGNKYNKNKQRDSGNVSVVSSYGRDYAMYEVGSPELWYSVHVQLFEKLSTPEGKSVWNDLTKGKTASVSSTSPDWMGQDLAIRYRSTKWIPRDEFFLPPVQLCLLVPSEVEPEIYINDNGTKFKSYKNSDFVILPEEDIINVNEDINKVNVSEGVRPSGEVSSEKPRKVMVRTARAILNGVQDALSIASQGTERFLTLKHRRPHHAQIDLEARADGNELVRVGSSGRISIAVTDSTRKTRTVLNLQVGNTGLAAARFRIEARDFDPILLDLLKNKEITSDTILIPPRHTRSIRLELPLEMPVDNVAHCSVTLLNDNDESVAVRHVLIKKQDRCFCVWHCDCVCLGTDPKLVCHEMDETHQKVAGLSPHDRPRHARSIIYQDVVPLNMFVIFTGVLIMLLICGLSKAILGLACRCVGTWGLHQLLQTPRKLDHYYERSLRNRNVRCDADGWPVHPDTGKRDVHLVSLPIEFFLNTIFFVCVPCIFFYEIIKQITSGWQNKKRSDCYGSPHANLHSKKCFSTQDMQGVMPRMRRRREGLRRWMSPQAQDLSTELWTKSLNAHMALKSDFMQPLLRDRIRSSVTQDSCQDSEQDDTDYVLTQMQKSRESLARSQKKIIDIDPVAGTPGIATSTSVQRENNNDNK